MLDSRVLSLKLLSGEYVASAPDSICSNGFYVISHRTILINRLYTGLYMVLHTRIERQYFGQDSSLIYEPVKWLSLNINEMYTVMMMENTKIRGLRRDNRSAYDMQHRL